MVRFWACLGLLLSAADCRGGQAADAIEGRVVNVLTGLPIKRATVILEGAQPVVRESDAEGRFQFEGLARGSHELKASKDGFRTEKLRARAGLIIKLTPLSVISGRVVDEDGEPIMNLQLSAMTRTPERGTTAWVRAGDTTTNDQGEYRIPLLERGEYLVRVSSRYSAAFKADKGLDHPLERPDTIYPATYYGGTLEEAKAAPVQLGIGEEMRGIDFRLSVSPAFRIRGRLARRAGSDAVVELRSRDGATRLDMQHAFAPESRFEFRGVLPGSYTILAELEDSPVKALGRQSVEVADHHVEGVLISLAPAADLPGTVKMEGTSQRPDLGKLTVRLRGLSVYFLPEAPVSSNLTFVLKDVVPTRFEVEVKGVPESCYVKSIKYAGEEILDVGAEPVNGAKLEITLSATAGRIEGVVTDRDSNAVSGAAVALRTKDGAPAGARTVVTDEAGSFHFGGLRPGEYRVSASEDFDTGAAGLSLGANGRETVRLKTAR
jgi:protocatechuate 3,4-dioxygenase beta subunit